MRLTILSLFLFLSIRVTSQTTLPQKIRISEGHCTSPCGYDQGFHDLVFDHELEYSLIDSTFRYKENPKKEFKKLAAKPTGTFTAPANYFLLDSLFQNFTAFKSNPGKYFIYRIELIYLTPGNGLPLKTQTMVFLITTNPEKIHPKYIDALIEEYKSIIKDVK